MEKEVEINVGNLLVTGLLNIPKNVIGTVIFAHGSGSSRFSLRNQFVASFLNKHSFATLLMDLLTQKEEEVDEITAEFRFNINLLASRLVYAAEFIKLNKKLQNKRIGYFGASTGAAAAIVAASQSDIHIDAIVSRGGRPDLAEGSLERITSPTLLLVGCLDLEVIELNRSALKRMKKVKEKELSLIPGATHLFEEPGTLEEVAEKANSWFQKFLDYR